MLNEEEMISGEEFCSEFKRKFSKFCKRCPVVLSYTLYPDRVDIYKHDDLGHKEKVLTKEFDYSTGVKDTIHEIKLFLCKNIYPVYYMTKVEERIESAKKINDMIEKGEITLDDVGPNGVYVKERVGHRPERILILSDELFMRNLSTNEVIKYKTKIPVTLLLKKLRFMSEESVEDVWKYLSSKIRKVSKIMESKK